MRIIFGGIGRKMPLNSYAKKAAAALQAAALAANRVAIKPSPPRPKTGGRRTRKSRGLMASIKKFFGMTRRSRQ